MIESVIIMCIDEQKTGGQKMFQRLREFLVQIVPDYAVLPLLACLTVNCLIYSGTAAITEGWKHYDFTLGIDRQVPLIPGFIVVYLGCYLFWLVNYIWIVRQGREHCMRFVTAEILSKFVCCAFFLLIPTTNVRPELIGNDIFTNMLRVIYEVDAATNLFPSIHCLVSWFCYMGLRGQKKVPGAYRAFSCLAAILVFISTQVTKQHYLIDIIGAIVIAEGCWYLGYHTKWYQKTDRIFSRLQRKPSDIRAGKKGKCG